MLGACGSVEYPVWKAEGGSRINPSYFFSPGSSILERRVWRVNGSKDLIVVVSSQFIPPKTLMSI